MDLPNINLGVVSALFTMLLTSLSVMWGINKAIIIAKSH